MGVKFKEVKNMTKKYEAKPQPVIVDAIQWFKNGDHPEDNSYECENGAYLSEGEVVRRFRRPDIKGRNKCKDCGEIMHDHGWLDKPVGEDYIICPGDWIVRWGDRPYYALKPDEFHLKFMERHNMYKQVETTQDLIGSGLNKPVATLRDEYGGVTQIIRDDRCYVLMQKIGEGEYKAVTHIYPEALEVLRHLPSPWF